MKCPIHRDTDLVCFCPKCRGSVKSERKSPSTFRNAISTLFGAFGATISPNDVSLIRP
jgi:hypothetical protein